MRRLRIAAVVAALLAALPGRPDRVAADTRANCPRTSAERPRYDGWGEMPQDGRLPSGFQPVRALHCTMDSSIAESDPDRLRYEVIETRTGNVTEDFLKSLALPDQEFTAWSHGACPAIAHTPTWVILIDPRGQAVIPRLPEAPCGEPRSEVASALEWLGFSDPVVYRFEGDYPY